MLAGDLDDALQHLARVQGARGVVGVDDDDGLGARGDLGLDVLEVRVPLRLLVADVVHGRAAGERGARGPQRVVRAGDQDLVTRVEQRLHAQVDELGHAVTGVDAVHVHVGQMLELRVLHDRLARGEQALGVRIALAVRQLVAHVLYHLVRGAETEGRGVADVELEDAKALRLHAASLVDHGAADIVQNVIELGGLFELAHGGAPCRLLVSWLRKVGLHAGGGYRGLACGCRAVGDEGSGIWSCGC